MELNYIRELIELIKETDIIEIQYEKDGLKISLKRESAAATATASMVNVPKVEEPAADTQNAEDKESACYITVKSPIVGTFYRSSTPDSTPLVELGDTVRKGQALCIVEAMKLMNEIESEISGIIVKIFPENGTAVEYGEPLFQINPL